MLSRSQVDKAMREWMEAHRAGQLREADDGDPTSVLRPTRCSTFGEKRKKEREEASDYESSDSDEEPYFVTGEIVQCPGCKNFMRAPESAQILRCATCRYKIQPPSDEEGVVGEGRVAAAAAAAKVQLLQAQSPQFQKAQQAIESAQALALAQAYAQAAQAQAQAAAAVAAAAAAAKAAGVSIDSRSPPPPPKSENMKAEAVNAVATVTRPTKSHVVTAVKKKKK